jgi:hypothetical protein
LRRRRLPFARDKANLDITWLRDESLEAVAAVLEAATPDSVGGA